MTQDDEFGPRVIAQNAMILDARRLRLPTRAVAVNRSLAGDHDVLRVYRTDKRPQVRHAQLSLER